MLWAAYSRQLPCPRACSNNLSPAKSPSLSQSWKLSKSSIRANCIITRKPLQARVCGPRASHFSNPRPTPKIRPSPKTSLRSRTSFSTSRLILTSKTSPRRSQSAPRTHSTRCSSTPRTRSTQKPVSMPIYPSGALPLTKTSSFLPKPVIRGITALEVIFSVTMMRRNKGALRMRPS